MKKTVIKSLFVVLLLNQSLFVLSSAPSVSLTDAEEIEAGEVVARDYIQQEGIEATPQTRKIDDYLQSVGERVAAHAQRKLPYRFRFDPSPTFRSAVGLPGGEVFVGAGILAYMDTEDQLTMVLGH